MRSTLLLLLLSACPARPPTGVDDQLRALSVNVEGWNVLHDAEPSREAGTDFGRLSIRGGSAVIDVAIVGTVGDWTLEVVGEPFQIELTQFGFLDGVRCTPTALGVHEGLLVVTAASQPDRSYRVPLRCEGTDAFVTFPLRALDVDGDDVLGVDIQSGDTVLFNRKSWVGDMLFTGGMALVDPGLRDGRFGGSRTEGYFGWSDGLQAYGEDTRGVAWFSQGTDVLLRSDGTTLWREEAGHAPVERFTGLYLDLLWADTDARWAVVTSGDQGWRLRDLYLLDTETGEASEMLTPDGQRWSTGYAAKGLALSPDRAEMLVPSSSFGSASLARIDLSTGQRSELLGPALEHLAEVSIGGDGPSITGWDVTEDFRYAAVVFDNVASDPGGFRQIYSGVYVIELDAGTTWLASVDANANVIDFAGDGFTGSLIETVQLDAEGASVLMANRVLTERSLWLEVP